MKRLSMRKIRDALRLQAGGLSTRKIAASLGLGQSTASEYLARARAAGLGWPLPEGLTDADLEQRLYPRTCGTAPGIFPQPDWAYLHREIGRTSPASAADRRIQSNAQSSLQCCWI